MFVQDEGSVARRSDQLEDEFIELIERVEQYPKMGRRADFFAAVSNASPARREKVEQVSVQSQMLEFREIVLSSYLVLYACSDRRTILRFLRHE
jgi:hypothetical protein